MATGEYLPVLIEARKGIGAIEIAGVQIVVILILKLEPGPERVRLIGVRKVVLKIELLLPRAVRAAGSPAAVESVENVDRHARRICRRVDNFVLPPKPS